MARVVSAALYTLEEVDAMMRNPLRDRAYLNTALGPDIADWLSWLENEKGARPATIRSYEWQLAFLAVHRPATSATEMTKEDLRAVRDMKPVRSRHTALAAFKSFFRWMYREERIDRNPADRIDFPKRPPKVIPQTFTDAEDARLVTAGPDTRHRALAVRDKVGILLLLRTGIRKAGSPSLQVGDIDTIERWVIVRDGKGGRSRLIPYAQDGDLDRALRTYRTTVLPRIGRFPEPEDYLIWPVKVSGSTFTPLVDRRLSATSYHVWWERICTRAGVRYRSGHTARHTVGKRGVQESGAERTQQLLGHRSIRTTVDEYGHMDVTDARELVEVLERRRRESA